MKPKIPSVAILFATALLGVETGIGQALSDRDRERFQQCREMTAEGRWSEARALAENLVEDHAGGPASRHRIAFSNELANLDQRLGFYQEAVAGYRSCLRMAEELDETQSPLVAQLQSNFAALLQVMGRFPEAEQRNREALALREQIEGRDHLATVAPMNNLAGLLWCIGDLEGAGTFYRRALAIRERDLGSQALDTARSKANLGGLLYYQGETEQARPLVREALDVFRNEVSDAHPETLDVMLFLGEIERASGSPENALHLYGRVVAGRREVFGEGHAETAEAYRRLGDARRELGDPAAALDSYRRSDEIYRAVLDPTHPDRIEGLYGIGLASLATGDMAEALAAARAASEVEFANLAAVLRFTDERQRLAYQNLFRSPHLFANLARLEGELAKPAAEELAEHLLRSKGVVLDSLIAEARMMQRADTAEAGESVARLVAARTRFRIAFLKGAEAGIELVEAEEELREARHELLTLTGLSEEVTDPTSLRLRDLSSALESDEVLVDYLSYDRYAGGASFEPHYGAVVLTSETVSFFDCGVVSEIDALVDELHRMMRMEPGSVDEAELESLLRTLHQRLVAPLGREEAERRHLYLCPDGNLHFVPFACLLDEDGRFLIEGGDIGSLSSSRELLSEAPAAAGSASALLVGNPDFAGEADSNRDPNEMAAQRSGFLPLFEKGGLAKFRLAPLEGAEIEVNQLSELLDRSGSDTTLLVGSGATEKQIRSLAAGNRFLHFATHGIYLPPHAPRPEERPRDLALVPDEVVGFQNPLFGSWLALAGANATIGEWCEGRTPDPFSDGILMANEAADLDLQGTLLVTLSACDTATGEATQGEGVLGIQRGFRMAGAEYVLTTLWPINDAVTVWIMESFYDGLSRGNLEDSLSATQRERLVVIRKGADPDLPVAGLEWAVRLAGPFLLGR